MTGLIGDVARAARLLPAQGPIGVFVHHNTLHALEDLPFADAVAEASRRTGAEPWLTEAALGRMLREGRIDAADLEAALTAWEAGSGGGEAKHLLCRYAFDTLDLAKLESEVFSYNIASARHLEKNGYVREGVRRQAYFREGRRIDAVMYGLLAEEWRARQAGKNA